MAGASSSYRTVDTLQGVDTAARNSLFVRKLDRLREESSMSRRLV